MRSKPLALTGRGLCNWNDKRMWCFLLTQMMMHMLHWSVKSLPLLLEILFLSVLSKENAFLFQSSSNYIVNSDIEVDSSKVISNVSYKSFQIIGTRKHANYCHPVIMANTNWLHGINEYTDWWNKQMKKDVVTSERFSCLWNQISSSLDKVFTLTPALTQVYLILI